MKKILLSIFVCFITLACSKKTADSSINPVLTGQISMKLDGKTWTGTALAQFIDTGTETFVLSAMNTSTQESLGIVLEDAIKVGTYKVKKTGNAMMFTTKTPASIYSAFENGVLVITSVKTTAGKQVPSGTFTGTAINSAGKKIIISEGKF